MNSTETLRQAFQLFEQEHYAAVEPLLFGLLDQEPDNVQALHLLGSTAAAQGRYEEAAMALQRALRFAPEEVAIRYKLGRAFYELARYEDAFLIYRDLIESGVVRAEVFVAAAAALQALAPSGKNDAQALALLDDALQLQPNQADTWHRKALLQERRKQWQDAFESMQQALRLDRSQAAYWHDAGLALHAQDRYEDALRYYDEALLVDHAYVDAHVSRGTALARLRQYDEAIDSYRRALRLQPDDVDAKVNQALSLLVLGKMQDAWPFYEWRWEGPKADPYRHEHIPAWNGGSSLHGKRLLLWAEQGQGDTIQFVRYVQQMVEAGANVVLEVQASLRALMASLPMAGRITLLSVGDPIPPVDVQLPLMSLPLICNTEMANIPAPVPYLHATPTQQAQWGNRIDALSSPGRLRIGLVCSGNAGNTNDVRRSIALERFAPLLDARSDTDFFVIQPDLRPADAAYLQVQPALQGLGDDIHDFSDTAAVLAQCDLLISVDTAAAHLAGAMGRPVWLALPFAPDWRWFLGRADSPWYPSAKLFRQSRAGEWDDVMMAMRAALAVTSFPKV